MGLGLSIGSPSLTRTPTFTLPAAASGGGLAGASPTPGAAAVGGGGGPGGMVVVGEPEVLEDGTEDDGSVPMGPVKSTTMYVCACVRGG